MTRPNRCRNNRKRRRAAFSLPAVALLLLLVNLAACRVQLPLPAEPTAAPESQAEATPTLTPAPAALDPSDQTLTLWHSLRGEGANALDRVATAFSDDNEWNILIAPEYVGDEEELQRRLLAGVQAGTPPSLFVGSRGTYRTLIEADALPALNVMTSHERWALSAETRDALMMNLFPEERVMNDRGHVRVPLGNHLYVLVYNRQQLGELGADGPPTTLTEFENVCRAYQEQFQRPCMAVVPGAEMVLGLAWLFEGRVLTEENELAVADEGLQDSFTFLRALADNGFVQATDDGADCMQSVLDGDTVFAIVSTAELSKTTDDASRTPTWGIAAPPHTGDEPVLTANSTLLSVVDPVPVRQLAGWLFVRWYLSTPSAQAEMASAGRLAPVHRDAVAMLQSDDSVAPALRQSLEWLPDTRTFPTSAAWFRVAPALEQTAIDVLNREIGPEEALEILAEEVE